jgi:hypothetical protein
MARETTQQNPAKFQNFRNLQTVKVRTNKARQLETTETRQANAQQLNTPETYTNQW